MGDNYYLGWTQEDLERELRRVQERMSSGAFTETASGGVRGVKVYEVSAEEVQERILYSLSLMDSDKWPFTPRASRTRAIASN